MRVARNLAFSLLCLTCLLITNRVGLEAQSCVAPQGACGPSGVTAMGMCEVVEDSCADACSDFNCQEQNGGPACINHCGSATSHYVDGSCTDYSYAYTDPEEGDVYCSNGGCTCGGGPI